MKRHPALVPLSRDHHHVLVITQQLCRATTETATEISGVFLAAWESRRSSTSASRRSLSPAFAAHGDPGHPVVMRMLQDHMLIRRDAARLARDPRWSSCTTSARVSQSTSTSRNERCSR